MRETQAVILLQIALAKRTQKNSCFRANTWKGEKYKLCNCGNIKGVQASE